MVGWSVCLSVCRSVGRLAGCLLAYFCVWVAKCPAACLRRQSDTAIDTNVITIHLAIIYQQLPAVLYITVINPLIEKDPVPQCLVWMLLLYVTPGYIMTAKLSFKTSYSVFLIFKTCSRSHCFLHKTYQTSFTAGTKWYAWVCPSVAPFSFPLQVFR